MTTQPHLTAVPALPTAGWSLTSLMRHLRRRGCPGLAGRTNSAARTALEAVYTVCQQQGTDEWKGTATTTANQLAEAAGVSSKTILRGLHELEDRGLVRWHRGGVRYRSPRPSIIVLSRRALAALLAAAGDGLEQREQARALETATRLQGLRKPHLDPTKRLRRRFRVSGHEGQPLPKRVSTDEHRPLSSFDEARAAWSGLPPTPIFQVNPAPAGLFDGLRSAWRTKSAPTKGGRHRG